jgi:hypothetical protein
MRLVFVADSTSTAERHWSAAKEEGFAQPCIVPLKLGILGKELLCLKTQEKRFIVLGQLVLLYVSAAELIADPHGGEASLGL